MKAIRAVITAVKLLPYASAVIFPLLTKDVQAQQQKSKPASTQQTQKPSPSGNSVSIGGMKAQVGQIQTAFLDSTGRLVSSAEFYAQIDKELQFIRSHDYFPEKMPAGFKMDITGARGPRVVSMLGVPANGTPKPDPQLQALWENNLLPMLAKLEISDQANPYHNWGEYVRSNVDTIIVVPDGSLGRQTAAQVEPGRSSVKMERSTFTGAAPGRLFDYLSDLSTFIHEVTHILTLRLDMFPSLVSQSARTAEFNSRLIKVYGSDLPSEGKKRQMTAMLSEIKLFLCNAIRERSAIEYAAMHAELDYIHDVKNYFEKEPAKYVDFEIAKAQSELKIRLSMHTYFAQLQKSTIALQKELNGEIERVSRSLGMVAVPE